MSLNLSFTPLPSNISSLGAASYTADAATLTWLSSVNLPSPDKRAAVIRFVNRLKSNNLWNSIAYIGLQCGVADLASVLVPLKSPAGNLVNNGFVTGDYDPNSGLMGGANKYFDTGFTLSGLAWGQPNCNVCTVVTSATTSTVDSTIVGAENSSTQRWRFRISNSTAAYGVEFNPYHFNNKVNGIYRDSRGIWNATLFTSPSRYHTFKNNKLCGTTQNNNQGSAPTNNVYLMAHNNAGTAAEFSTVRVAYIAIGGNSFTQSQQDIYYACVAELMASMGVDFSAPQVTKTKRRKIIIVTGQSNSVGYNTLALTTTASPFGNLMFDTSVGYESSAAVRSLTPLKAGNGRETIANGLCDHLSRDTGDTYFIASHGLSSTPMSGIKKGGTNVVYDNGMAHATIAKNLLAVQATPEDAELLALVVVHGESDDASNFNYTNDLVTFQSNYQTDLASLMGKSKALPMIITQMCTWCSANRSTPNSAYNQYVAAKNNPGKITLIPTYMLSVNSGDGLHYVKDSHRWMGEYIAEAINAICYQGKSSFGPMMPGTITFTGNQIFIPFPNAVGTIVFDTSFVTNPGLTANGTNLYGFEVADSTGTLLLLQSITIVNQTVVITLDPSNSTTATEVRYAWTAPSLGFKTGPTNGARGNLRDSNPATGYYTSSVPFLYHYAPTFKEALPAAVTTTSTSTTAGPTTTTTSTTTAAGTTTTSTTTAAATTTSTTTVATTTTSTTSSGLQAETVAYQSRMSTAGYTLSSAELTAFNNFFLNAKGTGKTYLSKIYALRPNYGNATAALVYLVQPSGGLTAALQSTGANLPTYSATKGLVFDGATNYVDSGFNPTTQGCIPSNFSMWVWTPDTRTGSSKALIGVATAASESTILGWLKSGTADTGGIATQNNSGTSPAGATTSVAGLLGVQPGTQRVNEFWYNGTKYGVSATVAATGALPNATFTEGCRRNMLSGAFDVFCPSAQMFVAYTQQFTAQEALDFYNDLNTLRVALGR